MPGRARILVVVALTLTFLFKVAHLEGGKLALRKDPPNAYGHADKKGPPPWAPAHGYRAKHLYYYYPVSGVYFDLERRLYFHLDVGRWRVSASLPRGIHIDLNHYVSLEMDTDKPYVFHSEVIKWYPPGKLKKSHESKGKGKGWK
jgi:hypothetical protein